MDKQELERQRKQILAEKEQFYRNNPELSNWVKMRKVLRNILLIYWIMHSVFSFVLMMQIQVMDGIGMEIFKLLIQLLWICAFLNPEGGWRMNIIVYVWAVSNFVLFIRGASFVFEALPYMPWLYLVVVSMEVLAPFLLLGIALYLTAFPKHRAMSEQVEDMMKDVMLKMKNLTR